MADSKKVVEILNHITKTINDDKDFLTELDNVIGDGDHGINLARGFNEVDKKIATVADKDIGTILKTAGMALVSTVGGASGPLYGTAFMYAGKEMTGKMDINLDDFKALLNAAIEGVKMRGKAVKGEKTMLDAMIPAYEAMKDIADPKEAFAAAIKACEEGIEYTKTIIATKGRASYLGERSIGHQDPGATSFTDIMKSINEVL